MEILISLLDELKASTIIKSGLFDAQVQAQCLMMASFCYVKQCFKDV